MAFLLGLAATPVANRLCDQFVFTWPVSVFVVHQAVLGVIVGSTRPSGTALPRWLAPTAAVVLVAACAAYYDLCRLLNLAMAWVFLMGLLPSWPLAVPLAYCGKRIRRTLTRTLWAAAAFSLYFWASAGWLWVHPRLHLLLRG
jgi:hypothetical protein